MKAPLIAVVVIVVLAAAVGAYYYMGGQINAPSYQQPGQTQQNVSANMLTGLQIATRISDYVATQRNADGFYHYSVNCLAEENCTNAPVYEMANTWPVYADVGLYKATGDSKYLNAAKADADKMIAWCENNASYCVYVTYQIYDLYDATKDPKYLDFVKNEADVISNPDNGISFSDDPMLLSSAAIEFTDLYQATKNTTFRDWAYDYIFQAQNNVTTFPVAFENNGNAFNTFSCWPQLANIRLYKETGDPTIIGNVTAFAKNFSLQDNVVYMWFMTDVQPCVDLYQRLADATGDKSYSDGAQKMAQYVVTNFWDTKSNPKVSSNDAVKFSKDKSMETVTDSSYMVNLLAGMKDVRFEAS